MSKEELDKFIAKFEDALAKTHGVVDMLYFEKLLKHLKSLRGD